MSENQSALVLTWTRKQPDAGILFSTYKSRGVSILPMGNSGSAGFEAYVNGNTIKRHCETIEEAEGAILDFIDNLTERRTGGVVSDIVKTLVLKLYHIRNPFVTDQEWGCFQGVVVAMPDEDAARAHIPYHEDYPNDIDKAHWPGDPKDFVVTFIGTAAPGLKQGQILASNMGA